MDPHQSHTPLPHIPAPAHAALPHKTLAGMRADASKISHVPSVKEVKQSKVPQHEVQVGQAKLQSEKFKAQFDSIQQRGE